MSIREQMQLLHDTTVIAWHEHISGVLEPKRMDPKIVDDNIEAMDILGIDKAVTSYPDFSPACTPEMFTLLNNITYETFKRHPGRVYGQAFVNPGYLRETLYELERCYELGFVGVKLYHQYYMDNPVMFLMIEKCIELDLPILMHSAKCTDWETMHMQPRLSNGVHMANIARRYPEATFIMGHIGGGGDWQWSIKAIQDTPNVFADIGGSNINRPLIEESVKLLGADRLLFATDGPWSFGIGKILGADITDEEKKTIFGGGRLMKYIERAGM